MLAVDGDQLPLAESQGDGLAAGLLHLFQVSGFGQALLAVKDLASADRGAPETHVVGVLEFLEISQEAVGVEIIDLLLTREVEVAGQSDDFHSRSHHEESHVKTDLVVAGTGRTVGDGVRADLFGITGDSHTLENPLR